MLKMTVRPLAIRNSSIPNRTPLRVEIMISSSTRHHPRVKTGLRPGERRRSEGTLNGDAG
jgi:hypothetical protein